MATIRNGVDILLQATAPRVGTTNLPGNITVPWEQIPTGTGKAADYATNDYDFVNTTYPSDKLSLQGKIDGKVTVFVGATNPTNYAVGDLWDSNTTPRGLKSASTASATYDAAHWILVSSVNTGDFASLDGKITPANRDTYLANNCISYVSTTKTTIHEITVHGSVATPTSVILTGAIYMTTAGNSVNTIARLNVKKWNGTSWLFLDGNSGNTIFDQAKIVLTTAGGSRVPFHLMLTCSESAQYQFSITAYSNVVAISDPSLTTLEIAK